MAETLTVTQTPINDDVTFVYMPDLKTGDFYVKGEKRYVLHFQTPNVFGKEFAVVGKGNNLVTVADDGQTECYWFDEAQLRDIVAGDEASPKKSSARKQAGTVSPYPRPIKIPPVRNAAVGGALGTRPIIIPPGK